MEPTTKQSITVEALVKASVEKVWKHWTTPEHIIQWNNASDDWHTPAAENDLREKGKFVFRMEAKDGSLGFDFSGIYDQVKPNELISYTLADGRKVKITFESQGNDTKLTETFAAETENPIEMQRMGWQTIVNNFKKHVETH